MSEEQFTENLQPADEEKTSGQSPETKQARFDSDVDLDTLLKIPVALTIEVGRTQVPLGDLLDTQEGTVIELEKLLEEPLDVLVNGTLIAHGVVVHADERFGLQITDIVSLQNRAQSL